MIGHEWYQYIVFPRTDIVHQQTIPAILAERLLSVTSCRSESGPDAGQSFVAQLIVQ